MIENNVKKISFMLLGEDSWRKLRDILVEKFSLCQNEADFLKIMEIIFSGAFKDAKEIDAVRKKLQLKLLSEVEKEKMRKAKERDDYEASL